MSTNKKNNLLSTPEEKLNAIMKSFEDLKGSIEETVTPKEAIFLIQSYLLLNDLSNEFSVQFFYNLFNLIDTLEATEENKQ